MCLLARGLWVQTPPEAFSGHFFILLLVCVMVIIICIMFLRMRKRKNVYIHINVGTGSTVLKNTVEIQDKKL